MKAGKLQCGERVYVAKCKLPPKRNGSDKPGIKRERINREAQTAAEDYATTKTDGGMRLQYYVIFQTAAGE